MCGSFDTFHFPVGYRNDRLFPHTNPYISNVTGLRNNADARRCSYFEIGLPVVLIYIATKNGLRGRR